MDGGVGPQGPSLGQKMGKLFGKAGRTFATRSAACASQGPLPRRVPLPICCAPQLAKKVNDAVAPVLSDSRAGGYQAWTAGQAPDASGGPPAGHIFSANESAAGEQALEARARCGLGRADPSPLLAPGPAMLISALPGRVRAAGP